MRFDILTLFPQVFTPYLTTSILGRAQESGALDVYLHDIRAYATDKHKTTDDTPYGGGAGMVMKVEPIDNTLQAIQKSVPREQQQIIVLSAKGKPFTQTEAERLAASKKSLTLICGRYEGIDQRVIDHLADEELSIGPYVLAGGELAALVVLEAVARLVPGVLGNPNSLVEESFSSLKIGKLKIENYQEYPHYTKPETYRGWSVPSVLLTGNHAEIAKWRDEQRRR